MKTLYQELESFQESVCDLKEAIKESIFFKPLSWLLHHANRQGKNENFYKIKNRILKKYGKHICYDIQFIPGKKCWTCGGTGVYEYFDIFTGKVYDRDFCRHCSDGWYKRPVWNILAKVRFGKYEFHQPWKRVYEKPDNGIVPFEGYIDHNRSKYGEFALFVLFLCFEKGYLKRWYKMQGHAWCSRWWRPKNWANNLIHIIKHGKHSIPYMNLKRKCIKVKFTKPIFDHHKVEVNDLPF